MIETLKDMKHGKPLYEHHTLERTANQILHHMEDKDSEDSLESTRARVLANARAIYGPTRSLDVISYAPTSSRKIGAAIVEHNPTGRSYIHCSSAKEDTRLAAVEHLLVITEAILQDLVNAEGITSSGWLPATPQAQHAAQFNAASVSGSVAGSVMPSVAGSAMPSVAGSVPICRHMHEPHHQSMQLFQPTLHRNNSDILYQTPKPNQLMPRTNSDVIAPKPVPVGQFIGHRQGRVQWNLGSEC
ncbi:hypothetical protein K505DRAFT_298625 [Melanomma pulvis-pyrius CBS 109.77]|uniref:Uncharacterized protein n=1 Tax=Melanomma pulvis-pyrius CBS 109.77 TaxID=1314802 RepID=A0A6A6XP49_9PLEO|nr:hypothetical protein K505DRAFT_298625 [Melanomma pulvis-pyrius CBS 109.77]